MAAMVNRSGLVASRIPDRLDSAVASFEALAAMRCIVAADSTRASRALQTTPPDAFMRSNQPKSTFGNVVVNSGTGNQLHALSGKGPLVSVSPRMAICLLARRVFLICAIEEGHWDFAARWYFFCPCYAVR